jgi:hypothetical protein
MKKKLALNLALLAIILGLAALAYFEPGKDVVNRGTLAAVDEASLSKITLENRETMVFEKKDGHWRLTAPFQAPVNEIRVGQLIAIAKAEPEADYPLQADNLAKFELDKPKARLTLGTTTLVFGGSDPINMRRYVQVGGTLHLVNDDFFHHLQAAATDYVDKKLLPEGARVTGIAIPGLKATQGQDGKWTREPAGAKPDLSELASLWATARAIDVKRPEGAIKGDPVRITLAEGNPVDFLVVQREPDLILARPDLGLQFELTGETARQLLNLPRPAPGPAEPPSPAPGDEAAPQDPGEEDESPPPVEGDDEGAPPGGENESAPLQGLDSGADHDHGADGEPPE